MQKLEYELEYKTVDTAKTAFPAVIVAAGSSSRMKGIDKQTVSLMGIPVLIRTLMAFEKSEHICDIAVVTRKERIFEIAALADKYSISKLSLVVEGGNCREESVKKGIELFSGKYEKALVHDGARPLVSSDVIARVADALISEDCVVCGVKVKDTVKRVDAEGFAKETLSRDELIAVQTPQGVNIEKFLSAAKESDLAVFTDDAALLESVGVKVKTVEGDYKNIKVTTPEDIALAEIYLSEEY